jgi:hypothetical protein
MPGSTPYTAASFHPDGLLLVTGTADAKAQIWEMRQQKAVTGFEAGGLRVELGGCSGLRRLAGVDVCLSHVSVGSVLTCRLTTPFE